MKRHRKIQKLKQNNSVVMTSYRYRLHRHTPYRAQSKKKIINKAGEELYTHTHTRKKRHWKKNPTHLSLPSCLSPVTQSVASTFSMKKKVGRKKVSENRPKVSRTSTKRWSMAKTRKNERTRDLPLGIFVMAASGSSRYKKLRTLKNIFQR